MRGIGGRAGRGARQGRRGRRATFRKLSTRLSNGGTGSLSSDGGSFPIPQGSLGPNPYAAPEHFVRSRFKALFESTNSQKIFTFKIA